MCIDTKMRFYYFILIFIVITSPISTMSPLNVFNLGVAFLDIFKILVDAVIVVNNHANLVQVPQTQKEQMLFENLHNINQQILDLTEKISELSDHMIKKMLHKLPQIIRNELEMENLRRYEYFIDVQYKHLVKYIQNHKKYENKTIIDFAQNVVSSNPNSIFINKYVHQIFRNPNFLEHLYNLYKPDTEMYYCLEDQSHQENISEFLNTILLIDLKSYVLERISYMLLREYKFGNFIEEINELDKNFKFRYNQLVQSFKSYIVKASTELWKCDPEKHKKGKTYTQITNFVHGLVLNKINLGGSCADECSEFTNTTKIHCNVESKEAKNWCKEESQKHSKCSRIINCQYVDSSMEVCKSNLNKNDRRYEYIQFNNGGRRFGKESNKCSKKQELETYRRIVFQKCSYCFCLCLEQENIISDRYINLRLTRSNITDNKVVIGLRFIKSNRIIFLQVQEGKLLPYGNIDVDSVRWVPLPKYSLTDKRISERQDYHTLTWEERSFELADITIPTDSVVTGVRFKKIRTRIHLKVLHTKFNFTSGKLFNRQNYFEDDPLLGLKHKELTLSKPDVPTRTQRSTYSDFTTNKYVTFRQTDYDKDAGQTTVPFFDIQPVASKIPVPLSGVGIFHKGVKGSGGFIAPKIFTYNFTVHMKAIFP